MDLYKSILKIDNEEFDIVVIAKDLVEAKLLVKQYFPQEIKQRFKINLDINYDKLIVEKCDEGNFPEGWEYILPYGNDNFISIDNRNCLTLLSDLKKKKNYNILLEEQLKILK